MLETRVQRVEELCGRLAPTRLEGVPSLELLARPKVGLNDFRDRLSFLAEYTAEEREKVEIRVKYRGYLDRERNRIRRHRGLERVSVPRDLDYATIPAISAEGREKLSRIQPTTVGQASRISGVSPADISVLLVALRRRAG